MASTWRSRGDRQQSRPQRAAKLAGKHRAVYKGVDRARAARRGHLGQQGDDRPCMLFAQFLQARDLRPGRARPAENADDVGIVARFQLDLVAQHLGRAGPEARLVEKQVEGGDRTSHVRCRNDIGGAHEPGPPP
jgi:hypothetical protein